MKCESIQKLWISSECAATAYGCKHNCEITLLNGVVKCKELTGKDVSSLVEAVAKDKISYMGNLEHFSQLEDREYNALSSSDKQEKAEAVFRKVCYAWS